MRINNNSRNTNFIGNQDNASKKLSHKTEKKDILALGAKTRSYNPDLDKGGVFTIVPILISVAICGRRKGDKK